MKRRKERTQHPPRASQNCGGRPELHHGLKPQGLRADEEEQGGGVVLGGEVEGEERENEEEQ